MQKAHRIKRSEANRSDDIANALAVGITPDDLFLALKAEGLNEYDAYLAFIKGKTLFDQNSAE